MTHSPLDLHANPLQGVPEPPTSEQTGDDEEWANDWLDTTSATPPTPTITDPESAAAAARARLARHRPAHAVDDRGTHRVLAFLASVAAAVLAVALAVAAFTDGDDRDPQHAITALPAPKPFTSRPTPSTTAAAHTIPNCPSLRTARLVTGADPGSTSSAIEAILAFEYAYYVPRSAEAAHAVLTDSADVPTANQLQAGIDSLPPGTRYCLTITPTSIDTYEVSIREQWPGKDPELLAPMTFTTTALPDGSHRISAIRPA